MRPGQDPSPPSANEHQIQSGIRERAQQYLTHVAHDGHTLDEHGATSHPQTSSTPKSRPHSPPPPPQLSVHTSPPQEPKLPAYLQGKNPYGRILNEVDDPSRKSRPAPTTRPSQLGISSDESQLRTSRSLDSLKQPIISPPQPKREASLGSSSTLPPIRQPEKPVSVQTTRQFFESKATESQRSQPFSSSRGSAVYKGATSSPAPVSETQASREGSKNVLPVPQHTVQPLVSVQHDVVQLNRLDELPAATPAANNKSKVSNLLTSFEEITTQRMTRNLLSTAKHDDTIAPIVFQRTHKTEHPGTGESLRRTTTIRHYRQSTPQTQTVGRQFGQAPQIVRRRSNSPSIRTRRQLSQIRELDQHDGAIKSLLHSRRRSSISHPGYINDDFETFVDTFEEPIESLRKLKEIAAKSFGYDGSSSDYSHDLSQRTPALNAVPDSNMRPGDGYYSIEVPDDVDYRVGYGRRKTKDFGYPGARNKPRATCRTNNVPLQNPNDCMKHACGHLSAISAIESNEEAVKKPCSQCYKTASGPGPNPSLHHHSRLGATTDSSLSSISSSKKPETQSGKTRDYYHCVPPEGCGDAFAQDLGDIIDSILKEHQSTLQHVINNIKFGQSNLAQLRRVSEDLLQRRESHGVHSTACEWQPSCPCVPPKGVERLNVGKPGQVTPNINDSASCLRESITSVPELVDLIKSAADNLGVDLDQKPTAEDDLNFEQAPVERSPLYPIASQPSFSSEAIHEKLDGGKTQYEDTWPRKMPRQLSELTEARSQLMGELDLVAEDFINELEVCYPSAQQTEPLHSDLAEEAPKTLDQQIHQKRLSRVFTRISTQSKRMSNMSRSLQSLDVISPEIRELLEVTQDELPAAIDAISTVLDTLRALQLETNSGPQYGDIGEQPGYKAGIQYSDDTQHHEKFEGPYYNAEVYPEYLPRRSRMYEEPTLQLQDRTNEVEQRVGQVYGIPISQELLDEVLTSPVERIAAGPNAFEPSMMRMADEESLEEVVASVGRMTTKHSIVLPALGTTTSVTSYNSRSSSSLFLELQMSAECSAATNWAPHSRKFTQAVIDNSEGSSSSLFEGQEDEYAEHIATKRSILTAPSKNTSTQATMGFSEGSISSLPQEELDGEEVTSSIVRRKSSDIHEPERKAITRAPTQRSVSFPSRKLTMRGTAPLSTLFVKDHGPKPIVADKLLLEMRQSVQQPDAYFEPPAARRATDLDLDIKEMDFQHSVMRKPTGLETEKSLLEEEDRPTLRMRRTASCLTWAASILEETVKELVHSCVLSQQSNRELSVGAGSSEATQVATQKSEKSGASDRQHTKQVLSSEEIESFAADPPLDDEVLATSARRDRPLTSISRRPLEFARQSTFPYEQGGDKVSLSSREEAGYPIMARRRDWPATRLSRKPTKLERKPTLLYKEAPVESPTTQRLTKALPKALLGGTDLLEEPAMRRMTKQRPTPTLLKEISTLSALSTKAVKNEPLAIKNAEPEYENDFESGKQSLQGIEDQYHSDPYKPTTISTLTRVATKRASREDEPLSVPRRDATQLSTWRAATAPSQKFVQISVEPLAESGITQSFSDSTKSSILDEPLAALDVYHGSPAPEITTEEQLPWKPSYVPTRHDTLRRSSTMEEALEEKIVQMQKNPTATYGPTSGPSTRHSTVSLPERQSKVMLDPTQHASDVSVVAEPLSRVTSQPAVLSGKIPEQKVSRLDGQPVPLSADVLNDGFKNKIFAFPRIITLPLKRHRKQSLSAPGIYVPSVQNTATRKAIYDLPNQRYPPVPAYPPLSGAPRVKPGTHTPPPKLKTEALPAKKPWYLPFRSKSKTGPLPVSRMQRESSPEYEPPQPSNRARREQDQPFQNAAPAQAKRPPGGTLQRPTGYRTTSGPEANPFRPYLRSRSVYTLRDDYYPPRGPAFALKEHYYPRLTRPVSVRRSSSPNGRPAASDSIGRDVYQEPTSTPVRRDTRYETDQRPLQIEALEPLRHKSQSQQEPLNEKKAPLGIETSPPLRRMQTEAEEAKAKPARRDFEVDITPQDGGTERPLSAVQSRTLTSLKRLETGRRSIGRNEGRRTSQAAQTPSQQSQQQTLEQRGSSVTDGQQNSQRRERAAERSESSRARATSSAAAADSPKPCTRPSRGQTSPSASRTETAVNPTRTSTLSGNLLDPERQTSTAKEPMDRPRTGFKEGLTQRRTGTTARNSPPSAGVRQTSSRTATAPSSSPSAPAKQRGERTTSL